MELAGDRSRISRRSASSLVLPLAMRSSLSLAICSAAPLNTRLPQYSCALTRSVVGSRTVKSSTCNVLLTPLRQHKYTKKHGLVLTAELRGSDGVSDLQLVMSP